MIHSHSWPRFVYVRISTIADDVHRLRGLPAIRDSDRCTSVDMCAVHAVSIGETSTKRAQLTWSNSVAGSIYFAF